VTGIVEAATGVATPSRAPRIDIDSASRGNSSRISAIGGQTRVLTRVRERRNSGLMCPPRARAGMKQLGGGFSGVAPSRGNEQIVLFNNTVKGALCCAPRPLLMACGHLSWTAAKCPAGSRCAATPPWYARARRAKRSLTTAIGPLGGQLRSGRKKVCSNRKKPLRESTPMRFPTLQQLRTRRIRRTVFLQMQSASPILLMAFDLLRSNASVGDCGMMELTINLEKVQRAAFFRYLNDDPPKARWPIIQ